MIEQKINQEEQMAIAEEQRLATQKAAIMQKKMLQEEQAKAKKPTGDEVFD